MSAGSSFRYQAGRALERSQACGARHAGVGKTSLVAQLREARFDPAIPSTEGFTISKLHLGDGAGGVRLHVWDFGFQEVYYNAYSFFLTGNCFYLIVVTGGLGDPDLEAEYWLRQVGALGGERPTILVLNMTRLRPAEVNHRAMSKYPFLRGIVRTDCQDGLGIAELRSQVETMVAATPFVAVAVRSGWHAIRERLLSVAKDYLSYDEFREICEEYGVDQREEQVALAKLLHELGFVIWYLHDPRLQGTLVLNPAWVIKGVLAVLSSHILATRNGEISVSEVAQLLDPALYPPEIVSFVIDLLIKFEFCFGVAGDEALLLFPHHLTQQEPELAAEFVAERSLIFEYHYPLLPESVLPRFIVRTHVMSEGLPRWKTGVILKYEGNRALVKADMAERKMFVAIDGPLAGRRRMLAVIRSDFGRIHRDLPNLRVREMVAVPGHPDLVVGYDKLIKLESRGIESFHEVDSRGDLVELNVRGLLVGLASPESPSKTPKHAGLPSALRIYFSYSNKDEEMLMELHAHLKVLQRQGVISDESDRSIRVGEDWQGQISEYLESADIILLLVSPDYLASDYCYEIELKRAMERRAGGEARVIPVILRPTQWSAAPFAILEALPPGGRPITLWEDRDEAWVSVAKGIMAVAAEMRR